MEGKTTLRRQPHGRTDDDGLSWMPSYLRARAARGLAGLGMFGGDDAQGISVVERDATRQHAALRANTGRRMARLFAADPPLSHKDISPGLCLCSAGRPAEAGWGSTSWPLRPAPHITMGIDCADEVCICVCAHSMDLLVVFRWCHRRKTFLSRSPRHVVARQRKDS